MKSLKQGLLLAGVLMAHGAWSCTENGKEGILPENDLRIPVSVKSLNGITEEVFNKVIGEAEAIYAPVIAQEGGNLIIESKWEDDTVNAYAMRSGKDWHVSMFGGLARHDTITADGLALVVCHEIGHHIGGAPKKASIWSSNWASNEGQADYFATLKCLRRLWNNDNNGEVIAQMEVPQTLSDGCNKAWGSGTDYAVCIRGGMAGDSVAKLFAALRNAAPAKFETPDARQVTRTDDSHPAFQCRLDTYFQGALCEVGMSEGVNQSEEVAGTCHASLGHNVGIRPHCWFKPAVE